jgi:DNA recombination protein RmuC
VLHLDVKFPVDNYLRHVDATDDSERQRTRQAFVADVAGQLKELHRRGYTEGPDSVDHLLMYLPSEAVFGFLCEHGPDLIDSALDRGIILCSPFTLLSVLTVVRESVEQFCLERRTDEILEVLRGFDQQWRRFGECIDRVDRHLTTLSNSFGELSGPRRRGLDAAVASISGVTDPSVAVDDR